MAQVLYAAKPFWAIVADDIIPRRCASTGGWHRVHSKTFCARYDTNDRVRWFGTDLRS